MNIPIISTKLQIPSAPRFLLPRPRLTDRLVSGLRGKLILVSAPAGFGKTSLIADWANQCKTDRLVSWVQLDEGDNELIRFLSYVISACQTHQKHIGESALAGLHAIPPVPVEAALISLINEIDSIEGEFILVLDDYHLIDTTAIHEAVGFLIEHLPAHMCMVIATRSDPPLPIHRLRARGQMREIRVADLRFNREETRRMLEGILETPFSSDDIAVLDSRVEGWAAGLQMVALSIHGGQDAKEFIKNLSGSHRYIMDYLTEEIYNQQPRYIQEFLLQTSILERLSGPLCDYVLKGDVTKDDQHDGPSSAQEVLEYLEHANLFVLPMDPDRHWYRYHHLFASLLRQRLRVSRPDDIPQLHKRASTWYTANGYLDEAFRHALSTNDILLAAQLVEDHGLKLLNQGAISMISGWMRKLPNEIINARPWLSVIFSWVLLLTGDPVNIGDYLISAEQGADRFDDQSPLLGHIAAIRAYASARAGSLDMASEQATKALDLLPPTDFSTRSVVSFVMGGVYYSLQEIPQALAAFQEASQTGVRGDNINVAVSALNAAGSLLRSQGKLTEAEKTYCQALKIGAGRSGRPLPVTASIYAGLAEVYLARRDLGKASEYARIGVELGEQWAIVDSQIGCYATLAHVAHLQGNSAEAKSTLDKAKRLASEHLLTPGTQERITYIDELIHGKLPSSLDQGMLIEPLTDREVEVLKLIAAGRSNREIAAELIIALGTVKAHTSSIYGKLEVRSRTEAVIKAGKLGLL